MQINWRRKYSKTAHSLAEVWRQSYDFKDRSLYGPETNTKNLLFHFHGIREKWRDELEMGVPSLTEGCSSRTQDAFTHFSLVSCCAATLQRAPSTYNTKEWQQLELLNRVTLPGGQRRGDKGLIQAGTVWCEFMISRWAVHNGLTTRKDWKAAGSPLYTEVPEQKLAKF